MTFSLLARDPETGALGGAAATGNLCVGGWVLRGQAGVGLSASQGHYPSTLWGEDVLAEMATGVSAERAVHTIVSRDPGQAHRQLLALDRQGGGAAYSGPQNVPTVCDCVQSDLCAGGNMLSHAGVVEAMLDGYASATDSFLRRLLAGLEAGARAGGDARGLMSAAVLIVSEHQPPVDLRVDLSDAPLKALSHLADAVERDDYARWTRALPSRSKPHPDHHE